MSSTTADIAVIGAGVAGLCTALALADTGLDVVLLGDARAGESSPAAGGILDAGHGFEGDALAVMRTARDLWPAFTQMLHERTGVAVPLNRDGVLQLATSIHEAERLARLSGDHAEWLDAAALTRLEPQLAHAQGALHFRRDGAVNPLVLLKALKHAVAKHVHARVLPQTVTAIAPGAAADGVTVTMQGGDRLSAMRVVIAGGVWSSELPGVPMHLPIAPVRGQLMSVASKALRHVVMLGEGYVIPRGDGRTILGGTEEQVGFDTRHTPEGIERIRALASAILPSLGTAGMLSTWAGLRPMTRDGLPIIGPDAELPSVIYACGHGRNGIMLGPMTGAVVAAHVTGRGVPTAATLFSPLRFS
ncbi:MAG TPA: FAD-dependent oxidoreductase [Gemmatimonadaceae bacterium]|nr:FAD-dependent oxidoreductase [Gemmatimonadaceae bacterium]